METLTRIINSLPLWVLVIFGIFSLLVIADIIWTIVARKRVYTLLTAAVDNPENAAEIIKPSVLKKTR